MNRGVLIAYASRCGSTGEVARAIARELIDRGETVDVRPAKEVSDLDGYGAVIVGSAVRFGKWLPDAVRFVERHRATLSEIPTSVFTVHALALDDSEPSQRQREGYLAPVRALITPKHEAWFAGKLEPAQLSLVERTLAKMVKAPRGDLRDWEAIRAWAREIV